MNALATLESMTEIQNQLRASQIVRHIIDSRGLKYTEASRQSKISLPTLNRMMGSGDVGLKFYRAMETYLGLPWFLFDAIIDGDSERVASLDLEPRIKAYVLDAMNPAPSGRKRRTAE